MNILGPSTPLMLPAPRPAPLLLVAPRIAGYLPAPAKATVVEILPRQEYSYQPPQSRVFRSFAEWDAADAELEVCFARIRRALDAFKRSANHA